jgi:hypothetical protein
MFGGLNGIMGLLGAGLMASDKKSAESLLPLLMMSGRMGGGNAGAQAAGAASAAGGASPPPTYLMNNPAQDMAAAQTQIPNMQNMQRPMPTGAPEQGMQPQNYYPSSMDFMYNKGQPQQQQNTDPVLGIRDAIGDFESGGKYSALGPITKSGDRAYGKYQVMGNNIGSWTREALGKPMSARDFLNNPQAQDSVALHRMRQYYDKYGNPEDVASMWFSGRPSRNNVSKDILGTSVPQYIQQIRKRLGQQPSRQLGPVMYP